jgi:hypothetical protein
VELLKALEVEMTHALMRDLGRAFLMRSHGH